MENKKTNKKVLSIAIALVLVIVFISLLCISGIENETQRSQNFELANLASEGQTIEGEDTTSEEVTDSNLVAAASSESTVDYSSYTDQTLPEKIDKNNIAQYVPVNKFNSGETIVYNGRNYGFVLVCQSGTNFVLLFREVYTPHSDGDGYDITLEVVFEDSYFKVGNAILNSANATHLALSDIKFNNAILDTDLKNNIAYGGYSSQNDDGAYYVQSRYSGNFDSFDDERLVNVAMSIGSKLALLIPYVGPLVSQAISLSGEIVDFSILMSGDSFLTETQLDTAKDFPLTVEGQLAAYDGLVKNIGMDIQMQEADYLRYNEDNHNFAKATFRVSNPNDKDYYINNNISFKICRYTGAVIEDLSTHTINSVMSGNGTVYNKCIEVEESNEEFNLVQNQIFVPLTKGNSFEFKPEEDGNYKFLVPEGYNLVINGEVQQNNSVYVAEDGCVVGIIKQGESFENTTLDNRMLAQDFYDGKFNFTNLKIVKEQNLNIGTSTLIKDIGYTSISSEDFNNDVFIADAGANAQNVDLYIADDALNVLAKATKVDGKLYVNYPMLPNESYTILCVNRSSAPLNVTLTREGGMTFEAYPYKGIQGLYYSFITPYTQYYNIYNADACLSDGSPIQTEGRYLEADKLYYLKSRGTAEISVGFSANTVKNNYVYGTTENCGAEYNFVATFIPMITATYTFVGGSCDVYGNTMQSIGVSQAVLYEGETYTIVKREKGGTFKIQLEGEDLLFGANNIQTDDKYGVFNLSVSESIRININIDSDNEVYVYDAALNEITYDHGYLLNSIGNYYVVVKEAGTYTVSVAEYLQEVTITLYIDGEYYGTEIRNYGNYFSLPIPDFEGRRDFNGWVEKDGTKLYTDSTGQSYEELLVDSLELEADAPWRKLVMAIIDGETAMWWTGDEFIDKEDGDSGDDYKVEVHDSLIDVLLNLKEDFAKTPGGKKEGNFLKGFTYQKINSVGDTDYYEFEPDWEEERYLIKYVLFNDGGVVHVADKALTFDEVLTSDAGLDVIFTNRNNSLYYSTGWVITETNEEINLALGQKISDLTPGKESPFDYDSDGDNIPDCVVVTMVETCAEVDYFVKINGHEYEVGDGYQLKSFDKYGFNQQLYIGKFVKLGYGDTRQVSYLFETGIVKKTDLQDAWSEDHYQSVTVELGIIEQEVDFSIKYPEGISAASGNLVTSYKVSDGNKSLTPGYLRGYTFNYWTYNGSRIDVLNSETLGLGCYTDNVVQNINLDYNVTLISLKPTSLVDYNIKDEVIYVDCSRFSLMVGMEFTIYPTVKEVTFANGKCNDTNIVVLSRDDELTIKFKNMEMNAPSGKSVIDAKNCPELTLKSTNSVTLRGGEASLSSSAPAIWCKDLILEDNTFYIYGGKSINYNYNGRAGIKCDENLTVNAKNVYVYGGSGASETQPSHKEIDTSSKEEVDEYFIGKSKADGVGEHGQNGSDGKKGTDGAVAVYVDKDIYIKDGVYFSCTGGNGGNGGNGGDGQIGGDGRDGSFGVTTITSGNGGDGGKGGDGGNGALAFSSNNSLELLEEKTSGFDCTVGLGGLGGFNGYGAPPGKAGVTIFGNAYSGDYGKQPLGDDKKEYVSKPGAAGVSEVW